MSRSAAAPAVHERHRDRLRPRPHGVPAARRYSGPAQPPSDAPGPEVRAPQGPHASAYAMSGATLVPPLRQPARPAEPRYRTARPRRSARPPLRFAVGGTAIALRVAETAVGVSDSRAMDRVVRSRAWVVIVGFGLIGIVAMQVSLLKLNSGIGRAVTTVATLERSNATLKADISRLSSGDRVQALAGQIGFQMPEPADVTYLRAGDLRSDGFQAARRMRAPDPTITGPAGSVTAASLSQALTGEAQAGTTATTPAATGTGAAPVTGQPATTTPATTTDPAAGTLPATTAPATAATTAPPATNGATASPPAATPAAATAVTPVAPTAPVAPQTGTPGVTLP